MNGEEADP